MLSVLSIVARVLSDLIIWCGLALRPRRSLEAEILFLRRQLALYVERGVKPRRIDAATRVSLALLSRWFAWRSALIVVRPETLIRWHRAGFRPLAMEVGAWTPADSAGADPADGTCESAVIANELLVKLGLRVSPRTVRKYLPRRRPGQPRGDPLWSTFLRLRMTCASYGALKRVKKNLQLTSGTPFRLSVPHLMHLHQMQ